MLQATSKIIFGDENGTSWVVRAKSSWVNEVRQKGSSVWWSRYNEPCVVSAFRFQWLMLHCPDSAFCLFHQSCINFPCVVTTTTELLSVFTGLMKSSAHDSLSDVHQHVFVHELQQIITFRALYVVPCSRACDQYHSWRYPCLFVVFQWSRSNWLHILVWFFLNRISYTRLMHKA